VCIYFYVLWISSFSPSSNSGRSERIRAELTWKVSLEIRNFSTSHGLVFQGARPRIIRITRSCRTESRIGCIGIGANPTCWRLTIGGVAMISDEQGRWRFWPNRTHVYRPARAWQRASRIRHLRLAVTRGFRPISLVPPDNFANGHSTPILAFSSVRGLYFAPFSRTTTTYLEAIRGNPARISFNSELLPQNLLYPLILMSDTRSKLFIRTRIIKINYFDRGDLC